MNLLLAILNDTCRFRLSWIENRRLLDSISVQATKSAHSLLFEDENTRRAYSSKPMDSWSRLNNSYAIDPSVLCFHWY